MRSLIRLVSRSERSGIMQQDSGRKKKDPAVDNSDRHLCKTCKFRSNRPTVNSCDYADLMKHSRGCKIEECTKYEKGARMKKTDVEE